MNGWTSARRQKGQLGDEGSRDARRVLTSRLGRFIPVDRPSQNSLANDLGDIGTLALDVVVEEDLVELVGHVHEHLNIGAHVDLEGLLELVYETGDGGLAEMSEVGDGEEDTGVLLQARGEGQRLCVGGKERRRKQATHHVANVDLLRPTTLVVLEGCPTSDELARGKDGLGIREGDMDEAVEEGVQGVEEGRLHLAHKLAGKILPASKV
jgi:hypothetical protein